MSNKRTDEPVKRRPSKRERRMKIMVYLMVIAMILSSLTAGLAFTL